MNKEPPSSSVRAEARVLSPHTRALYEAGKALLIESVTTGREFCKTLISVSTASVPVYLALLTFVLPKDYHPSWRAGAVLLLPVAGMLAAALVAGIGFMPKQLEIALELPQDIETQRQALIRHRRTYGFGAAWLLLVSFIGAIAEVALNLPNVS